MTDRPIIFSAPMVRALLDGRKTQTRRVLKPQPSSIARVARGETLPPEVKRWPYAPGDRLWVREAWGMNHYKYEAGRIPKARPRELDAAHFVYFATEDDPEINAEMRRRPSIHMPRWASRLTLTVTDVRVQRLQEISRDDAIAEGCDGSPANDTVCDFSELWESLHGADSWDANPWVVALTFTAERGNIDKASR